MLWLEIGVPRSIDPQNHQCSSLVVIDPSNFEDQRIYMCIYINYTYIYTYTYMRIYIHICVYTYTYIYMYIYNYSYRGYITTYVVFFPTFIPMFMSHLNCTPVAISNPGSMCQNGHDQLLLLRYTDKRADLCRAALRAAFCQVPGWCNEHWIYCHSDWNYDDFFWAMWCLSCFGWI